MGIDNDSYCPNCHNELIHRYSNVEVLGIEQGGNAVNVGKN